MGAGDGIDEAEMITECSLLLARVDDRAYRCALIRDANQIVERITLPMSFPWHHTILPVVRNIPRDIDEMPALLCIEDEGLSAFENGPLGYGGFETGKQRRRTASGKEGIRIVSRRADDVGVIELTMVKLPGVHPSSSPHNESPMPKCATGRVSLLSDFYQQTPFDEKSSLGHAAMLNQPCDEDEQVDGMLSLESFTIAQARKKRKVEQVLANTQRIFLSVKVGNTSSRSSLFAPYAMASTPLLREAVCPQEVQQGKALTVGTAKKVADEIGAYDCRFGAARSTLVAKSGTRVQAGRTRLIWTYNTSSENNKVMYSTTLKRERLEIGAQKRPTNVRVGVRLNGVLLALDADLSKARLSDSKVNGKLDEIPYSSKAVDSAINKACDVVKSIDARPQCLVDTGKLLDVVRRSHIEARCDNIAELPFGVNVVRPVIDCLPSDHGSLLTTCTIPGRFLQSVCVQECLNKAARRQGLLCSICWTGSQPRFAVEECSCGLTAHLACLTDRGERLSATAARNDQKTWKCPACSAGVGVASAAVVLGQASTEKRAKRATKIPAWLEKDQVSFMGSSRTTTNTPSSGDDFQRCVCCPLTGGAMSSTTNSDGEKVWVHEVCRIWQEPLPIDNGVIVSEPPAICALCGTSTSNPTTDSSGNISSSTAENHHKPMFLTKCAANGCFVRFHPMCALLVSKLDEEQECLSSSTTGKEPASPQSRLAHHDNKSDIRLTNKYTLTMAQISYKAYTDYTKNGIGKLKSREQNTSLVPLAFCGIHNPNRDPSLYGCYPAGHYFDEKNLRIPPKRKRAARLSH